jgi:hypothetical protein
MGLPLEETTPLTEVIESSVERITESLEVLGPLVEKAVSDATRSVDRDSSITAAILNGARLWTALIEQASLSVERTASNITLLTHDEIPVVEWVSQTPIDLPGEPPASGWSFRVGSLVSSAGRSITDREVTFTRLDGSIIDRHHPVHAGSWDNKVLLRVRTWGWVPTGPVAGSVSPLVLGLVAGSAAPVYCALG